MISKASIDFVGRWAWFLFIGFLVAGWFYPVIGIAASVCMLAPIVVAAVKGSRFWCRNLCPRGSFNDHLLARISRRTEVPDLFKTNYFRIVVFIFLMTNFSLGILGADSVQDIGFVFYRIIFATTAVAILLGIVFRERAWCTFCPMGSLATWVVRLKQYLNLNQSGVQVIEEECVDCTACEQECPLNLEPHQFTEEENIKFDCIDCSDCIEVCPVDALENK